nr:hypothetical protein [Neorhizobium tomejilense]
MIDSKKAKALSFAPLALVDWLLESPSTRFVIRDEDWRGNDTHIYEVRDGDAVRIASSMGNSGEPDFLDRLGGKVGFDLESLRQSNVLQNNRSDAVAKNGAEKNGYKEFLNSIGVTVSDPGYNRIYRVGNHTAAWWEESGKARFVKLKEKRDEERARANRIIVVGAKCTISPVIDPDKKKLLPVGFKLPMPSIRITRPSHTATVVKETDTRIYVRDVQRIRPAMGFEAREESVIKGKEPNQYIERESLMVDGVRSATPRNIIDADAERVADYHAACKTTLDAVLEPLLALHARLFQAESMHEDLMREAIDKDKQS